MGGEPGCVARGADWLGAARATTTTSEDVHEIGISRQGVDVEERFSLRRNRSGGVKIVIHSAEQIFAAAAEIIFSLRGVLRRSPRPTPGAFRERVVHPIDGGISSRLFVHIVVRRVIVNLIATGLGACTCFHSRSDHLRVHFVKAVPSRRPFVVPALLGTQANAQTRRITPRQVGNRGGSHDVTFCAPPPLSRFHDVLNPAALGKRKTFNSFVSRRLVVDTVSRPI
mmetsp:Transcript_100459/g.287608  ORF Transcript_100459/g.287608 Transcript_100459/m.287608 type:complete len:226 (-) Transcript_100459:1424-2101(-)